MRRRLTAGFLLALLVSLNATSVGARSAQTTSRELRDAALVRSEPEYPALAKAARVSGTVEVELTLDQEGNVKRAQAISGHPLLKDAAVAAAQQWKFDPAKLSFETSSTIVGTLAFVFTLASATPTAKEPYISEWESSWEANLSICLKEIERRPPNNTRLTMALANLAVSVFDEKSVNETVRVFEDVERRDRLPAAAKPYYGKLLVEKYDYDLRQVDAGGEDRTAVEVALWRALPLFLDAYYEGLANNPNYGTRQIHIGWFITNVYRSLGNEEEGISWSKRMLSERGLPDTARAQVSYELGVQYWKKAHDLLLPYTQRNQTTPETHLAAIRGWVTEGYSYIQTTQSLDPHFANAWFYEKLLAIIESNLERDVEKKLALKKKIDEAQERFLSLVRERQGETNSSDKKASGTYTSGLPLLNQTPTRPSPPPPPPPPPSPHSTPGAKPPGD
ncbi:MAG: energy transducer TonB [Blastocatellia bacterium]